MALGASLAVWSPWLPGVLDCGGLVPSPEDEAWGSGWGVKDDGISILASVTFFPFVNVAMTCPRRSDLCEGVLESGALAAS